MTHPLGPDRHHHHRTTRPSLFTLLGPMPALLAMAAVVTAAAAVYSARTFDAAAVDESRLEALDEATRRELAAQGFLPRGEPLAPQVEALVAERGLRLPLSHGTVTCGPPRDADLAKARAALSRELLRYPTGFLRKARLRRVLFCEGLEENEKPIPSLPNYQSTLIVDVDGSDTFLARLVHHEVFHFVDFADDGVVVRDPSWERLNRADFRYEGGGRVVRDPEATQPVGPEGFVTRYATSALEEDKAEIFAWLMNDKALVAGKCASDPVLRAKVDHLDALVQRFFPAPSGARPYGTWP